MGRTAVSFEVRGSRPSAVAEALARAALDVSTACGAVVFVAGALERRLEDVAEAVATQRLGVPVLIAAGTGVLTERTEIEGEAAASGLVWRGGDVEIASLTTTARDVILGQEISKWLGEIGATSASAALLFARPQGFTPETFGPLREGAPLPIIAGAGTVGDPGVCSVDADGSRRDGNVFALLVKRRGVPIVRASDPCRYLTELLPITEAHGAMLVRIAGRRALDVLSEAGESTEGKPLVMTILASEERGGEGRGEVLIRGVQGVDPGRGALMISEEIREGSRIAFGVRDPACSKETLTQRLREAARDNGGGAPEFALYFNCSGRGEGMYGTRGVDTRIIGERFGRLPLCGLNSAFEIAPYGGPPALQLYNGVFVLFSSPN